MMRVGRRPIDWELWKRRLGFAQVTLNLFRDLVLTAMAILTVLLVGLGGDPKELNALDWARLVVGAFALVAGPIMGYVLFRALFGVLGNLLWNPMYMYLPNLPMPRGFLAWYVIRFKGMSSRDYIRQIKEGRRRVQEYVDGGTIGRRIIFKLVRAYYRFDMFQRRIQAYAGALVLGVVAFIVLKRTLTPFLP